MLFRKKIEPACVYCSRAAVLEDGRILCAKRGITTGERPCRKFRYDPCKRVPPRPKALDFSKYDGEDFSL